MRSQERVWQNQCEARSMHARRPEGAILPKGVSQRMRLPWGQGRLAGQELSARKAESVVRRWQARTCLSREGRTCPGGRVRHHMLQKQSCAAC